MLRFVFLLFIVIPVSSVAADSERYDGVGRVVAMSDIHGAYGAMVRTLANASILGPDAEWTGGDAHLVIVGDLLDRGPESRKAMDLLMRLEGEARAAGGQVHVLLGNHEAMNLMGDLRYVSAEEYAAFTPDETGGERASAFAEYTRRHPETAPEDLQREFDDAFPRGYFAHRRAFAADGTYGRWLLTKPIVAVINGTAFVHAGLSPMLAEYGLDGVNGRMRDVLVEYVQQLGVLRNAGLLLPVDGRSVQSPADVANSRTAFDAVRRLAELDASDLNAADGPLWYRGNVFCGELVEEDRLSAALVALGAERVVIGHTPTPDREILQRFDGRIYEVDTGMLANYYGGSGHALLIEGDTIRVVSERSREFLAPHPHPRRVGLRPGGELSAADLENLLQHGSTGPVIDDADGRRVTTVTLGDRSVTAVVADRASRGNYPDVAAYRLDRLLELDMVPVAVVRDVDGDPVSLQFLPPKSVDEERRAVSGQGGGAYCPLAEQWEAMYVFDSLIFNEGRTRRQMLYSPDVWQLLLVGHDAAFTTRKGRPRQLAAVDLDLNTAWRKALAALDEATLEQRLGDVLDAKRRKALLARRDELLSN